jgi:hypothetical protein
MFVRQATSLGEGERRNDCRCAVVDRARHGCALSGHEMALCRGGAPDALRVSRSWRQAGTCWPRRRVRRRSYGRRGGRRASEVRQRWSDSRAPGSARARWAADLSSRALTRPSSAPRRNPGDGSFAHAGGVAGTALDGVGVRDHCVVRPVETGPFAIGLGLSRPVRGLSGGGQRDLDAAGPAKEGRCCPDHERGHQRRGHGCILGQPADQHQQDHAGHPNDNQGLLSCRSISAYLETSSVGHGTQRRSLRAARPIGVVTPCMHWAYAPGSHATDPRSGGGANLLGKRIDDSRTLCLPRDVGREEQRGIEREQTQVPSRRRQGRGSSESDGVPTGDLRDEFWVRSCTVRSKLT